MGKTIARKLHMAGAYSADYWYGDVVVNGKVLTPERSLRVRRHSPTGFAWGYSGSGPAQLALAILLEAGLPEEQAVRLYQPFKVDVIATLDAQGPFEIDVDLEHWLKKTRLVDVE